MNRSSSVFQALCLACLFTSAQAAQCPQAIQIKGGFGLNLEGRTATGEPYVALGIATFERGTFTLQLTRSEQGAMSQQTLRGTLTTDQCAVRLTSQDDPNGFTLQGQIVPPGNQWRVTEIRSRNPVVASGSLRRIGLQNCTNATLRGSYVYVTQGYGKEADGTNWLPVGKTGRESFDSRGCTAYRETIKEGSRITRDVFGLLDYVVQPDCSFQLLENDMPVFQGILVNKGQSIPYMVLQEGVTRSGEYTQSAASPRVLGCEANAQ